MGLNGDVFGDQCSAVPGGERSNITTGSLLKVFSASEKLS